MKAIKVFSVVMMSIALLAGVGCASTRTQSSAKAGTVARAVAGVTSVRNDISIK